MSREKHAGQAQRQNSGGGGQCGGTKRALPVDATPKDNAVAEAEALERALDELPALDDPWQCCDAALMQCCFDTGLPPPSNLLAPLMPAADSTPFVGTTAFQFASAAATTVDLPTPQNLSRPLSSSSSSSPPLTTTLALLHQPLLVLGTATAAVNTAVEAVGHVAKELKEQQHLCTAPRAEGQQHSLAAAAAAATAAMTAAGHHPEMLAGGCCDRTDVSQPDPAAASTAAASQEEMMHEEKEAEGDDDLSISCSCPLPPTPHPPPSAEFLPAFSRPCDELHTDV